MKIIKHKNKSFVWLSCGLIVILFWNCNQTKNSEKINNILNKNQFVGQWKSLKRPFPFSSVLTINDDSTFYYNFGACTSSGFSNGKWVIKTDTIILTSFEVDACLYIETHFETECLPVIDIEENEDLEDQVTISDKCQPEFFEYYVIFNEERLIIENNKLKHIPKNPDSCPENVKKQEFRKITKRTKHFVKLQIFQKYNA